MQNIVFRTFHVAPSCLNASIDNLVIKVSPWKRAVAEKTDKSDTNFRARARARTGIKKNRNLKKKTDFKSDFQSQAKYSLTYISLPSLLLPPFFPLSIHSFSSIPRGVFREGDSTRQKQTTDITSYRWIPRVLLYGRLSMGNFQGRSENDCENNFGSFHGVISTRCDNVRLSTLFFFFFFPIRYSPSTYINTL